MRYGPRPDRRSLPGGAAPPLAGVELGAMWAAHCRRDLGLARQEAGRLRVLWRSRNLLAYRCRLDDAQLERLVAELCA